MYATTLACARCGERYPLANHYSCTRCGSSLEVAYDYDQVEVEAFRAGLVPGARFWDFGQLLPVRAPASIVTLGEGGTPLVPCGKIDLEKKIALYFKDETRNPTGAFKDRPNTVGISMARDLGLGAVAIASTGNGGGSLAAYAAKAGMPCFVFIPEDAPAAKMSQAIAHGATLVRVEGHYGGAYRLAYQACMEFGWANLTSTYLNPYTMEGDKTIAYELYIQLKGEVPDWIVVPLGAGALLSGILKGYEELRRFGLADRLPRMIGVQAKGCSPITSAFEAGLEEVEAWESPHTVAGGICDPLAGYARDGTRTLQAIRVSHGAGVSVEDTLILDCMYQLARREGLFCEPSAAASLAAVHALLDRGVIRAGDSVVALLTGHGLKDAHVVLDAHEPKKAVPSDLYAFWKEYQPVK